MSCKDKQCVVNTVLEDIGYATAAKQTSSANIKTDPWTYLNWLTCLTETEVGLNKLSRPFE